MSGKSPTLSPQDTYRERLEARREVVARCERQDLWLANLRLVVFLGGVAWWLASLAWDRVPAGVLVIPAVLFVGLVAVHARVLGQKRRALAAVAHFEQALRRLTGTWPGTGIQRPDRADETHAFAADLDLFGRGSIFELLCQARTRAGEETLADWLTSAPPLDLVRTRQEAVRELRDRVDLREEWALLAGAIRVGVHPEALTTWGAASPTFSPTQGRLMQGTALALSTLVATAFGLWAVGLAHLWPVGVVILAQWLFRRKWRARLESVSTGIEQPEAELAVLARVLAHLEQEPMVSPGLRFLQDGLRTGGLPASRSIRQLQRLLAWYHAQRNQFFAPVAFLLMWSTHFSVAIERWRQKHGPAIGGWLARVGEFEALSDLAGYAFEHPTDPFPELVTEGPVLAGTDLGHPLLPGAARVRNSVQLDAEHQLILISGSNMSGKTTLLRTVGVNVVLALAGAPVCAVRLSLSRLSIGATLRIHDSIQQGRSRFFNEIVRLRGLLDIARERPPLLFLLDELLHGTNSQERKVGAEGVIRRFLENGSVGLVTTHDLALTDIVDRLGPRAVNVHFADQLVDGRLKFDYRMRPGVVGRSNAVALMESIGLISGGAG